MTKTGLRCGRRSGKSVILQQILHEIREKTDNTIFMNFEDRRISANIPNGNALVDYVEQNRTVKTYSTRTNGSLVIIEKYIPFSELCTHGK
ncbi:MAG: hypothetical protein HFH85_16675 [Lachnospiraceae bacterium]|nr:hypothetical protein [Lachnospiraceae bacterium]